MAKPYAVWQVVNGVPENYLAGRPDLDGFTLQVDVYAATGDSARKVRDAIRDAVELEAYVTRWGTEGRDPETRIIEPVLTWIGWSTGRDETNPNSPPSAGFLCPLEKPMAILAQGTQVYALVPKLQTPLYLKSWRSSAPPPSALVATQPIG